MKTMTVFKISLIKTILLLVSVLLPVGTALSADSPVSLSIGPIFSDLFSPALVGRQHDHLALRDHLITDLAANYDCVVQMRSRCMSLSAEQAIESMKRITQSSGSISLPPAEVVVGVQVYEDLSSANPIAGMVECVRTDTGVSTTNDFAVKTLYDIPSAVAQAISAQLSIASRKPDGERVNPSGTTLSDTWAVLPFIRINKQNDVELGIKLEAYLQDLLGSGHLVDRQRLDQVMLENKLQAIGSSFDVQRLAEIVGADYFITGQIGKWSKNLRVNIQVVHALTGSIVGARAISGVSENELHARVLEAAGTLVREAKPLIAPRNATPAERLREARILTNTLWGKVLPKFAFSHYGREAMVFDSVVATAEGNVLLMHDSPEDYYSALQWVARNFLSLKLSWNNPLMNIKVNIRNQESPRRALNLLNTCLTDRQHTAEMPAPLVLRATAHFSYDEFDKALALIAQHEQAFPDVSKGQAAYIKGLCLWHQNRHAEALALVEQAAELEWSLPKLSIVKLKMTETIELQRKKKEIQSAAAKGGEAELEELKKLFAKESKARNLDYSMWQRFLTLLEKFDDPERIVLLRAQDLLRRKDCLDVWLDCIRIQPGHPPARAVHDLWLLQAKTLIRLGRKEQACRLAKDVEASSQGASWGMMARDMKARQSEAQKLIKQIETEIGPVAEFWKTAGQLESDLGRFSLYIVPEEGMMPVYTSAISNNLSRFFGPVVRVLPSYKLQPSDRVSSQVQLDAKAALRRLVAETPIPDDALWVVFLTCQPVGASLWLGGTGEQAFCVVDIHDNRSSKPAARSNPLISSIHNHYRDEQQQRRAHVITRSLIYTFQYMYGPAADTRWRLTDDNSYFKLFRCGNLPCVFSQVVDPYGYLRHQMCPDCQQRFMAADFEDVHNDLMQTLRNHGATIIPAQAKLGEADIQPAAR